MYNYNFNSTTSVPLPIYSKVHNDSRSRNLACNVTKTYYKHKHKRPKTIPPRCRRREVTWPEIRRFQCC